MAQATPICPARLNICALRATRLDASGAVAAGPNNGFVSRRLISIGLAAVVDEGEDQVLTDGCGADIARYRTPPKYRGQTLTIAKGLLEPALEEMLLGGSIIVDDSTSPVPIGRQFPDSGESPNPVAIEAWSKLRIGAHTPGAADTGIQGRAYPYVRYLFTFVEFTESDTTLETDFGQVGFTGTTQENPLWGDGPWGDQPETAEPNGFYVFDEGPLPEASCGYLTAGSS